MDVTSKNVGCNEKDRILNSKKHTCDHLTFCLKTVKNRSNVIYAKRSCHRSIMRNDKVTYEEMKKDNYTNRQSGSAERIDVILFRCKFKA